MGWWGTSVSEQPGHCPKTCNGQGDTEEKRGIDSSPWSPWDLAMVDTAASAGPAALEFSPCQYAGWEEKEWDEDCLQVPSYGAVTSSLKPWAVTGMTLEYSCKIDWALPAPIPDQYLCPCNSIRACRRNVTQLTSLTCHRTCLGI